MNITYSQKFNVLAIRQWVTNSIPNISEVRNIKILKTDRPESAFRNTVLPDPGGPITRVNLPDRIRP
jgi:hypothetical protein